MNAAEQSYLCDLLKAESGLALSIDKRYLLETRLTPVARRNDLESLSTLVGTLRRNREPRLVREVVDAMTTNESLFFRDGRPFDQFRDVLLPEILKRPGVRQRTIRIWSAAASTGQEAYSLAMILSEPSCLPSGQKVSILCTDISSRALERAKAGRYAQFEVQRGLPTRLLVKHFDQRGKDWYIKDHLRKNIEFRVHNLLKPLPGPENFDMVFCRNVLIYFDAKDKRQVLQNIAGKMAAGGYLVIGATENLLGLGTKFQPVTDLRGVYQQS